MITKGITIIQMQMITRLTNYIDFINKILEHNLPVGACFKEDGKHFGIAKKDVAPTRKDYEILLKRHLEQIDFFQKERLIIFIGNCVLATIFCICICLFLLSRNLMLLIIDIPVFILLFAISIYYIRFSNKFKSLYLQYDNIVKMMQL